MRPRARTALALLALLAATPLAGCGTDPLPLAYEPAGPPVVRTGPPVVALGAIEDERPGASLGTATGIAGTPERVLVAAPAHAVRDVAVGALMARGLFAPAHRARYVLRLHLVTFDAGEGLFRHATARLRLSLVPAGGGRVLYRDEVAVSGEGRNPLTLDSAAYVPTADLDALAQRVLNEAVAKALDAPGFRAALRG